MMRPSLGNLLYSKPQRSLCNASASGLCDRARSPHGRIIIIIVITIIRALCLSFFLSSNFTTMGMKKTQSTDPKEGRWIWIDGWEE
jgi:hypothetical protein